jgi:hypothetical protein
MDYAQITPGRQFAPIRSLLYYSQRLVTPPVLRRAVADAVGSLVRWRQGRGAYHDSTPMRPLLELSHSGYVALGRLLDSEQCDDIIGFLRDKLLYDRDRKRPAFVAGQAPQGVRVADYHLRDIVACPHILALANSKLLLGLAARYLRCQPTISALGLRWSFPVCEGESVLQSFHRDSEDWRYLKVLVYLTDVDASAGPHVYVHGSHLTQAPVRLRFYSDAEIAGAHRPEHLLTATGARGFCFAVDTAGIHKGAAPLNHPRLMLQIQYSLLPCYAYRYEPQAYSGRLVLDPYVNRLIVRQA